MKIKLGPIIEYLAKILKIEKSSATIIKIARDYDTTVEIIDRMIMFLFIESFWNSLERFKQESLLILDFFKDKRDGVISILGISYIFGYILLSYNGWINNFGPLPLLDPQYFLAGSIPLIILIIVFFLFKYLDSIVDILFRFWSVLKVALRSSKTSPSKSSPITSDYNLALENEKKDLYSRHKRTIPLIKLLIAVLGLYLITDYSYTIFPNIPQEFGGISPRYAYLDVKCSELSNETLKILSLESNTTPKKEVQRTGMVDVYYAGGDFMLFRPHSAKINSDIYKIKSDIVKGVAWCKVA